MAINISRSRDDLRSSTYLPPTSPRPPGGSGGCAGPSSILQIFTLTLLTLLLLVPSVVDGTAGFYADQSLYPGGYGQTVLLNRLPAEHRRAVKREILALLGLHHRPRPGSRGRRDSAPSYMLDLYKTLSEEGGYDRGAGGLRGDGVPPVVRQRLVMHNLTLPGMEDSAGGADMIASFVNIGEYIELMPFCFVY